MKPYDEALKEILTDGVWQSNKRTGIRCKMVNGILKRYKLNADDNSFPILSRRKVYPSAVFAELLWFISGSTRNQDLERLGAKFWTPWVDKQFERKHGYTHGSFGPVYGFNLRYFGGYYGNGKGGKDYTSEIEYYGENGNEGSAYGRGGFDQLDFIIKRIKEDSSCRRILFTLWNPQVTHKQRLPPCHGIHFQITIDDEGRLSSYMSQRSCDFPVGVPANIQFYSALTIMIAQQTGYRPYEFVHSTVNSHIYENQLEAVHQYLASPIVDSPKVLITPADNIFSYSLDNFEIVDYNPGPSIKIPVAV
jgi:thymidylate synthase